MTQAPRVDVFWSMRSPYCYFSLDRLLEMQRTGKAEIVIRPVYPIAVRNADFFKTAPKHYRPYHLLDSQRLSEYLGVAYRRPVPDPIVQNLETSEIAAEQPYIRRITRLAAAAGEEGKSLAFQDKVMRLIWDGRTDDWHEGSHIEDAMSQAGLDAAVLSRAVAKAPERFDAIIEANQEAQAEAGHGGVPVFVLDGEPFFGQDRIELLQWRMKLKAISTR